MSYGGIILQHISVPNQYHVYFRLIQYYIPIIFLQIWSAKSLTDSQLTVVNSSPAGELEPRGFGMVSLIQKTWEQPCKCDSDESKEENMYSKKRKSCRQKLGDGRVQFMCREGEGRCESWSKWSMEGGPQEMRIDGLHHLLKTLIYEGAWLLFQSILVLFINSISLL